MLYLYLDVVVRGAAEAAIFKKKRRVKLAVILMIIDKYIFRKRWGGGRTILPQAVWRSYPHPLPHTIIFVNSLPLWRYLDAPELSFLAISTILKLFNSQHAQLIF